MRTRPGSSSLSAGSARWFLVAFLVLVVIGTAGGLWIRSSNFEEPDYVAIPSTATASVSGTVVDSDGRPVPGLELDWFHATGEHQGGLFFGGRMFVAKGESTVTASDGTFRFEGLDPNVGYVAASSDDPLREGSTGQFKARAGFEASGLELRVKGVAQDRRLQLRLVHADGSPAAGVSVKAERSGIRGSWSALRMADASGEVELVAPWGGGMCLVTVTSESGTETTFDDVPMEGTRVELAVPR